MAATIIDTLVVELGLDPAKFNSGQQAALAMLRQLQAQSQTQVQQVQANVNKVGNLLTSFRREAITSFGLIFGGQEVKHFIDNMTNANASAARLGRTLGSSAEDVSAFRGAMQQTGGTAQGADATLASLNQEIVRFSLTGKSEILPILNQLGVSLTDQNGKWKTALDLYQDIGDAAEKQYSDPRRRAGILALAGFSPDGVNLAMKGGDAIRQNIKLAREALPLTKEAAAAAEEYQKQTALLDRNMNSLGQTLGNLVLPFMNSFIAGASKMLSTLNDTPEQRKQRELQDAAEHGGLDRHGQMVERFGEPPTWLKRFFGLNAKDELAGFKFNPPPGPSSNTNTAQVENMIRRYAVMNGIDPNQAISVARKEGLNKYTGDRGSSFGPYQLHYGGVAGDGMAVGGLGDIFTKSTGLDARDPSTVEAQIKFAMGWARAHGWSDWHGWTGDKWAGINRGSPRGGFGAGAAAFAARGGGGSTDNSKTATTTVDIGAIHVNAPNAQDAAGISKEIGGKLDREFTAISGSAGAL